MKIWNLPAAETMPFTAIEEERPVALLTSGPAWTAVCDRLPQLNIRWQREVVEASLAHWDNLAADLQGRSQDKEMIIYAAGGGLVADGAKYVAAKLDRPMVCLPTALSVDAFITWASGYRRDGCVYYQETKPPERIILDFEVLAAAPPTIRAAGICDVLSIATGSWDWRFAHERGKNPSHMPFIPYVYDAAQAILDGALACAEAAGAGDAKGLKQLYDCLALEVQLCNQIGHSRPEEGSEHYFAYAVENMMGKGLPHGDLVGPAILLIAEKQGQDVAPLQAALEACRIPLHNIPDEVVEATLLQLAGYAERHQLPYGIAYEL
ncbi:MAG: iron-containing alcohol dehydrogenase [Candidatus Promineifilaceae bacterium]|nr:iron-containing alcohol dehydrogenase [Candidatus Promineifilaceae bacterium]